MIRDRTRRRRTGPGVDGRPKRPRISRRAGWLIAAGCVLLVWVLSGFLLRALNSGEVLGGTSMSGVELGGETRDAAAELIAGIEPRRARLTGGGQVMTVGAPQAGLLVDAEASAELAYSAGRSGIGAILKGPLGVFGERDLEVAYGPVEQKRLTRTVDRIAGQVDRDPFVGALEIEPGTLRVSVEEPEGGIMVRPGATRVELVQTFRDGHDSMRIPVRRLPAPTRDEVEAVAADAERYLREPVRIATAGGAASFTPKQIAKVLAIEPTDDGIRLGADPEALGSLIANFAGKRDLPTRDATLDTPALPPVNLSEQGDLTWKPKPGAATVKPARTGRQIRQAEAADNLTDAIREDRHQVRFPTERVRPQVTTNQMKGATSLLGTFTTGFSCCEPRVTNIQRMAATVDGTVIGAGGQFSLNDVAGERTRANGYKPAPTIGENNELIDTVGGGVSQFSTTMYNAAYFAGLTIDSHTAHSFYIDRYPPGRESTLNYGTIDLLWTNDTEAPVVVRSSASDTAVTVSIYGDNGGRRVRADTRSRSSNSLGGFDITIDRVITEPDGSRERDSFTTSYGLPAE